MTIHRSRPPVRRRTSPLARLKKIPRDLRRPAWRWSFLTVAACGWTVLGAGPVVLGVTAVAAWGWWPVIRPGRRRRRR